MVTQAISSLVNDSSRDRVSKLREALGREQQEVLDIEVLLQRLDEEDALDRQAAVRAAPAEKITAAIGSGFEKRRKEREAAIRKRDFLAANIETRTVELGEAEEQVRAEARAELRADVESARVDVEDAWRDFVKWQAEGLASEWPRLIAAFTAFNSVRDSAWAGVMPESEVEEWRANEAAHPTPVPLDFLAAVEMVWKATCDPFGDGYLDGNSVRDGIERLTAVVSTDLRQADSLMPVQRGGTEQRASSARVLHGFEPDRSR